MKFFRTFISQLKNDDSSKSGVSAVDILETYGMAVEDFPFVTYPETKDVITRDWKDEDGEDVYIPETRRIQAYDIQVKFLYVGTDSKFRSDLNAFIQFLYGKNSNAVGSRLAIYDEHVNMGRKDITIKQVSTELFFRQDIQDDISGKDNTDPVLAEFNVTFRVHNPTTEVSVVKTDKSTFTTATGVTLKSYTANLTW